MVGVLSLDRCQGAPFIHGVKRRHGMETTGTTTKDRQASVYIFGIRTEERNGGGAAFDKAEGEEALGDW